jgi:hypothetical protein
MAGTIMVSWAPHLAGSGCVESSCALPCCAAPMKTIKKSMDKKRGIIKYTKLLYYFKRDKQFSANAV